MLVVSGVNVLLSCCVFKNLKAFKVGRIKMFVKLTYFEVVTTAISSLDAFHIAQAASTRNSLEAFALTRPLSDTLYVCLRPLVVILAYNVAILIGTIARGAFVPYLLINVINRLLGGNIPFKRRDWSRAST